MQSFHTTLLMGSETRNASLFRITTVLEILLRLLDDRRRLQLILQAQFLIADNLCEFTW